MPKYLILASYTAEGAEGLLKGGGSARRKATEELVKEVGGRVEAFYFAFGKDDAVVIIDVPDQITAAALSLHVTASGALRTRATVLITPEEIDEAARRRVDFRAPG
jgi:uncharacterized protein with GYD domain